MKLFLVLLLAIATGGIALFSFPGSSSKEHVQEKTLEENLGQMLLIGFEGKELTLELASLMKEIRPGGVLLLGRNIEDKAQLQKLIADLQEISINTTGLPLFIAVDQESKALARIPFADNAADLREIGVNMNLAPVLDSANKGDFLYERSFKNGNAAELARSFIEEHQKQGVIAVPKHFPGYDGVRFNPEAGLIPQVKSVPDISSFRNVDMRFVMISHVVYEDLDGGNPFPFSAKGIEFLKEELGRGVLVISDDLLSKSFVNKYAPGEIGELAIESGVDVLLAAGYPDANLVKTFYDELLSKVSGNETLEKKIESKGMRIQAAKQGL